jgi:MYXO-CTERM domain-containing protein
MPRSLLRVSGAALFLILTHSAAALAADVTCYVDSVGGSDSNDGKSESTPLLSPSKASSACTIVKFKRGSEFKLDKGVKNLGLTSINSIKTLTNYGDESQPLPRFVKDHVDGSGGMIQAFSAITVDGLYLAGSKSGNAMSQLADGIGVMLGANSKLINSEITLCDIGAMTSGENVQVMYNYIHDLSISVDAPPGVDPNQVGGAEGIFVNSSHVEVAYNRFINCSTAAAWVSDTNGGGIRCDGGATEVTVPLDKSGGGGEVTDVRIHHNFSYNSCGFFEVSTMPQSGATYVKGKFTNSIFHDNVMVDSGWISLLQINNTRLTNVTWANNTIVHHYLGTTTDSSGTSIDLNDFGSSYIQAIPFNSTSSGVTGGGELEQGDVYWTNNIWYFDQKIVDKYKGALSPVDATHASTDQFLKNVIVKGDKFFSADPGFVDVTSTSDPKAYDIPKSATDIIDQGVSLADITSDFVDRPRPAGAALDLGAFEYSGDSAVGGKTGSGGAASTGGASTATAGGTSGASGATKSVGGAKNTTGAAGAATGAGGVKSSGSSAVKSSGGAATNVAGGAASTSVPATGATNSSNPAQGGKTGGGSAAPSTAGQSSAASSNSSSAGGQSGATTPNSGTVTGQGGNATSAAGAQSSGAAPGSDGCGCRVAGRSPNRALGFGLLALSAALLTRSRRRRA